MAFPIFSRNTDHADSRLAQVVCPIETAEVCQEFAFARRISEAVLFKLASRMVGTERWRDCCLEMICPDFLAG
jgi:hypothetical protein